MNQGSFGGKETYKVDIVLCVDGTGSMKPVIDLVKKNALNLPDDILKASQLKGKTISALRLKIIVFRDYVADGEHAMEMTDFLNLPDEKEDLNDLVASIIADGGGDEPEDGLEALAYAMKSDWQPKEAGTKRRQIIAVWTDASTHELGFGKSSPHYDKKLPKTFDELTDWWGDDEESTTALLHYESKRLVLFAPKAKAWTQIHENWDNVLFYPSVAGQGMAETDYSKIIDLIVGSI